MRCVQDEQLDSRIIELRCRTQKENLELSKIREMLIPETEYQEKYKGRGVLQKTCPINKRFVSAGVTSKGRAECQPLEYDFAESPVPLFSGESTTRSSHAPQPTISRLPISRPPSSRTPTLLGEQGRHDIASWSRSVHCPIPVELARSTAPAIPLWIREKLKAQEYQVRYDLASSYQADYCGLRTRPRKICQTKNTKCEWNIKDNPRMSPRFLQVVHKPPEDTQLHDYKNSLLYRTSYSSTYLPPSVFEGPPCHPSKYHPSEQ